MRVAASVKQFLRLTIVGGLMFLVPIVVIMLLLAKAFAFAKQLTQPLVDLLPWREVVGLSVVTILAVFALLAVSLLAGIVARTSLGQGISRWLEDSLLGHLPQYQFARKMADSLAGTADAAAMKPVLVAIEGGWRVGFSVEATRDDWVAVFMPNAPKVLTGDMMYMPSAKVRPLQLSMVQALNLVRHGGIGSGATLRGVDLTLPAGL